MNIKLIYKDPDFLVINKPAGMLVHDTQIKNQKSKIKNYTVIDWLLENYPEVKNVGDDPKIRPGIVHRLDRDTSGALLVCLNQKTFEYFKKQFQDHQIKKTYLAVVWGTPKEKEGIIDKPIGLKSGTTKRTVFTKKAKMTKEAVTKYKVLKVYKSESDVFSLLQVEPLTGRTHQIRVHLAFIGHPVIGDVIYGSKKMNAKSLFLHAESLEFTPPSSADVSGGKRLKISVEAPEEFTQFAS